MITPNQEPLEWRLLQVLMCSVDPRIFLVFHNGLQLLGEIIRSVHEIDGQSGGFGLLSEVQQRFRHKLTTEISSVACCAVMKEVWGRCGIRCLIPHVRAEVCGTTQVWSEERKKI